jgi:diaminopimelate decarboxylase
VDAGFNNLARPILYGSYHPISVAPAEEKGGQAPFAGTAQGVLRTNGACPPFSRPEQDVVIGGPLCESGDIFTQEDGGYVRTRRLPQAAVGDLLVIECAGAYGFVMGSNYNSRPLAAEVLVDDGRARLVRRRQTFEDLIREEIPSA